MRAASALIAFLILLAPAAAETNVEKARRFVAELQSPNGVWEVEADGTIRHVQSGLGCPLAQPTSELAHVFHYRSPLGPGMDIGCDYGRPQGNAYAAKFTIFAVKLAEGDTLESVYAKYRTELTNNTPGARSLGPAIVLQQDDNVSDADRLPEVRSEEFEIALGGKPYKTALAVSIVGDWAIEIRATHPLGTPDGLMDEPALSMLWLAAVSDLKAR